MSVGKGGRLAEIRAKEDAKRDAAWLDDSARYVAAARMAQVLGVSVAWMMKPTEEREPLEFEQVRFACEGEPTERYVESEQVDLFE